MRTLVCTATLMAALALMALFPAAALAAEEYVPTLSSLIPKAINFIILFAILYFVLKKYVIDFFKGRSERIEQELSAARLAQEEAQRKAAEYEEKYRTVADELSQLKENMKAAALDEKEKILNESKEIADKMVANAKSVIEIEFAKARSDIHATLVQDSLAEAEQKLKSEISDADNEELVSEYVSGLRRMK
ncbi:ATP synthase F0 subunit B [Desulfurispira natronophila]|uniref:ATP synthase subunit b n=1 Tax=Desulfurispira natronophila TaxID=682562 RepID=A0A7W7Y2W3_9BACT|nr:ATP synthase F0 subunit B [Desulfurispira natronophila]MBB5021086.1 F-type H+-transporting ATPase subunit b [Desulfurispira natronophila]